MVTCTYADQFDQGTSGQFTVPAGVSSIHVVAVGGTGGGQTDSSGVFDPSCSPLCGGRADRVSGDLAVTSGQVLALDVAGNPNSGTGGTGGGGNGCNGGGGASNVRKPDYTAYYMVAAGGGGEGCQGTGASSTNDPSTSGGDAGKAGSEGVDLTRDGGGGGPGSSTAIGAAGTPSYGTPDASHGTFESGGFAGRGDSSNPPRTGGTGGGGGSGYFGGGGGGGGAASTSPFDYAGSGGGGGGGGSLIPAGGSQVLDSSKHPEILVSYVVAITSPAPPAGTVGQPYSYAYAATGDSGFTYAVTSGSLPAGLSLSNGGALAGTPTAAGTYTYIVTATGATASASREDTVMIATAPLGGGTSHGGTGAGGGSPGTGSATVALKGRALAASGGVTFGLSCQGSTGSVCRVRAELSTLEHLLGPKVIAVSARKKRTSRRVIVARREFTLAAGQTRNLTLRLNRTGTKLLRSFNKLPVTLTVTLVNNIPPRVLQTKVTITRKTRRSRRRH